MPSDPDHHHRRSIRLKGYDYSSAGAYFITLCTFQRRCLFGQITDGAMQLDECGQIVAAEWRRSSTIRQEIDFDQWVIMPNHLHGIVLINPTNPVGAHGRASLPNRAPRRMGVAHRRPDRCHHVSRGSNRPRPNVSTPYVMQPAPQFGSAIITNTLFAMKGPCNGFGNIFKTIRRPGKMTSYIHLIHPSSSAIAHQQHLQKMAVNQSR